MYKNYYYDVFGDVLSITNNLPAKEKLLKDFDYCLELINNINQIVRFDDFFPELDQDIFNNIKITEGMVGILKDEYGFQCCMVEPEGLPRKDGRPYRVIARYIRVVDDRPQVVVKDHLLNDKDIVLFYNTAYGKPDLNIWWLAKMMGETDVSIYKNILFARYAPLLRVKSEKEKKQMLEAINKIVDGEISTMVSDDTFEDLLDKEQDPILNITDVGNSDKIQYLSHLFQDFIKRFTMRYGCPISGVEKMAQQNNAEINGDVAYSWLVPIDMLNQAKEGCNRAKELWPELTIEAHFGTLHELMYIKFAQDITKDNPNMNVSIEDNQNLEDLAPSEMFEAAEEDPEAAPEEPAEEDPEEPEENEEPEEEKKEGEEDED